MSGSVWLSSAGDWLMIMLYVCFTVINNRPIYDNQVGMFEKNNSAMQVFLLLTSGQFPRWQWKTSCARFVQTAKQSTQGWRTAFLPPLRQQEGTLRPASQHSLLIYSTLPSGRAGDSTTHTNKQTHLFKENGTHIDVRAGKQNTHWETDSKSTTIQ